MPVGVTVSDVGALMAVVSREGVDAETQAEGSCSTDAGSVRAWGQIRMPEGRSRMTKSPVAVTVAACVHSGLVSAGALPTLVGVTA
jgi:hypothetical protein